MPAPPINQRLKPHWLWAAPVLATVRMASTGNLTLSGLQTVDGISGAANDRVLVKDQSTGSQNGIYLMQSGAWVREYDESTDDPNFGYLVRVRQGTVNGSTLWQNTNTSAPTIGSTALTFTQAGAGSSLIVQDEGTPLATAATTLNFVGPLVVASGTGATKTITVTGALDDLTDVTITSATTADRLRYSGSAWVNSALVWTPMTVFDPTTGNYLPLVDGSGNQVMTEV